MKSELKGPGKKFIQVSLPAEFAALVRSQADLADRSMADQLKHWGRIASAIESVVPSAALSELKGAGAPGEVLPRLAAYLRNPAPSALLAKLEAAQAPRYGVDPTDPKVAIRVDPDGAVTKGTLD